MADDVHNVVPRAQTYAAAAFAFFERFPFSSKGRHAANQFYKASSSATSNYCAAKRGRSTAEFISKLGTVVEEMNEENGDVRNSRSGVDIQTRRGPSQRSEISRSQDL
jgi:hypothetical protein